MVWNCTDLNYAFRVAVFDILCSNINDWEVDIVRAVRFPFNPGLEMKRVSFRCDGVGHLIATIDHGSCKSEGRVLVNHMGASVVG